MTEQVGRSLQGTFTDYVLTIEGGTRDEVFDFLDRVVVPTLETVTELDVGLSSHTCNDDGDTYHSLLERNKILAERLDELLGERAALQQALRNEFNRD